MKKRVIKKKFNRVAKKSIKSNKKLFNRYNVLSIYKYELNSFLKHICNEKRIKKFISYNNYNINLYVSTMIEDIEGYIYNYYINKNDINWEI